MNDGQRSGGRDRSTGRLVGWLVVPVLFQAVGAGSAVPRAVGCRSGPAYQWAGGACVRRPCVLRRHTIARISLAARRGDQNWGNILSVLD